MSDWIATLRGALTLKTETFIHLRDRRDAFFQGVAVIVLVALLAGLPGLVTDLLRGVRGGSAVAALDDATDAFEQGLQQATPLLQNMPAETQAVILEQARAGFKLGMQIGSRIEQLPTALPRPLNAALQALGGWLSRPFGGAGFPLAAATLGTWLGYGIWVMLAAKLLGGRGSLTGFFGATALFAVPHVLNILGPLPYVGALLGFIAWLWGAVIYVKATAVSHELSVERAVLAVLLPLLVAFVAALVLGAGLATVIALAIAGAQ